MPTTPALPAPPGRATDLVPTARQWISVTTGRIAPDGYSWMQAVCWAQLDNSYRPAREHGPKRIGETTLRLATELARLAPCRPGVDYLMRVLRLSKRTVQYHLGILREAGLLAYRTRGTRVRGKGGRASEFVWTIPAAFDAALHLVTRPCDRYIRSLKGIADKDRTLMRRLAKMARKTMRRPRRPRVSGPSTKRTVGSPSCTPMGGGSDSSSPAGDTSPPPEAELERGTSTPSAQKKPKNSRALNPVGRRHQLARELTEQVDWLRGASVPRIAWIARRVSDAGWTVQEVRAWLYIRGGTAHVRRPSGLLAILLNNATNVLNTPVKRAEAVTRWHAAVDQARRHRIQHVRTQFERHDAMWQPPRSESVRRMVTQAFAPKMDRPESSQALPALAGPQDLSEEDLQILRQAAQAEYMQGKTGLVTSATDEFGRHVAEAMYGLELVQRALHLSRRSSQMALACSEET